MARRKTSWGRGVISGQVQAYGWMALGVYPKNTRTLEKVFESGHPQSEKGSYVLERPFAMNFHQSGIVADNPEKHLRLIKKLGLVAYLMETA